MSLMFFFLAWDWIMGRSKNIQKSLKPAGGAGFDIDMHGTIVWQEHTATTEGLIYLNLLFSLPDKVLNL